MQLINIYLDFQMMIVVNASFSDPLLLLFVKVLLPGMGALVVSVAVFDASRFCNI